MTLSLLFLLLLHFVQAQFIQRYNLQNGVPHWRRQMAANIVNDPVLQPDYPVYLEYNCHLMPSICRNARSWLADSGLSNWPGRAGKMVFTYDNNAAARKKYRDGTDSTAYKANREHRRDAACTKMWRNNRHKCPEPDQPDVMPGPWPHKGLETKDPKTEMEIEAVRLPNGDLSRSGRMYTCDEFPPATFIEGGIGMPGYIIPEGAGQPGTTYCAPFGASKCGGTKIASEQDWQGSAHASLQARLKRQIDAQHRDKNNISQTEHKTFPWKENLAIQFHLRLIDGKAGDRHAAKIWFRDYKTGQDDTKNIPDDGIKNSKRSIIRDFPLNLTFYERAVLGESMGLRDLLDYGYSADSIEHVDGTQNIVRLADGTIQFENETVIRPSEFEIPQDSTAVPIEPRALDTTSALADTPFWNITAEDVDKSLSVYSLQTQQEPNGDAIDIIALGEMYIRGQLSSSRDGGNVTDRNSTSPQRRIARHLHHGHGTPRHSHTSGLLDRRAVEGPIQCGVDQPCKDGSCCNKDGKCGYKEAQCGPDVCLSNCDAKAMCGINSPGGSTKCGLKLCCSYYGWCGTADVHCDDPEPQYGKTPCQEGYGSCAITKPPSCGKDSGTSTGRRIAYYQGWNTRERACNKVTPKQINTAGLTHLFYAFVFFHPTTFEIMPMNEADIPLYKEFTDLKTNKLQTWVAIGGWSFNDPGLTERAFSDMVSTANNRAAFIHSLMTFMDTYRFQGADIDWEYPAEPKRGGRPEDTDNLVLLIKEMRAAFGTRYGLSIVLAPDYWYLRGFKPAEMQAYVDFMGFMSYDLHGPWDTDVKTLGSVIRPQSDITEIEKGLTPLWFDGVDPSKINLGLAYYGRSYKLVDPNCARMGCPFVPKEGGTPGECTNFPGVISNREIRQLIKDENITPVFNETAMVKYFTYGANSWIAYDDDETYTMKEAFANDRCLGGTMIWSIDFDADVGGRPGGADSDLIWVDPKIWEEPTPTVQCFFPCTLILPPFPAETVTTIDYPRVTVTEDNSVLGTVTFRPITVTDYTLSSVVVGSSGRKRQADMTITIQPKLSTATVWPESTWMDDNGESYTTRPTRPALNFPSPDFRLANAPTLHVRNGPPSPTVSKCAFPALSCPPNKAAIGLGSSWSRLPFLNIAKGPALANGIFYHDLDDDYNAELENGPEVCVKSDDKDHEEDPGETPNEPEPPQTPGEPDVPIPPPSIVPPEWLLGIGGIGGLFLFPWLLPKPNATVPFKPPVPVETQGADFSKDAGPFCYDEGIKAERSILIEEINNLCGAVYHALSGMNPKTLGPGLYQVNRNFMVEGEKYIDYLTTFEIAEFCEWRNFDFTTCGKEFRKIVDGCNTRGENGKQGGIVSGNCIKWRIDPNEEIAKF